MLCLWHVIPSLINFTLSLTLAYVWILSCAQLRDLFSLCAGLESLLIGILPVLHQLWFQKCNNSQICNLLQLSRKPEFIEYPNFKPLFTNIFKNTFNQFYKKYSKLLKWLNSWLFFCVGFNVIPLEAL